MKPEGLKPEGLYSSEIHGYYQAFIHHKCSLAKSLEHVWTSELPKEEEEKEKEKQKVESRNGHSMVYVFFFLPISFK